MGFREVNVVEVKEVLRAWLEGTGLRAVAERAGVDRKTARRYVQAAQAAGLERSAGFEAVDDDVVTAAVDGRSHAGHKDAAMRAHPTQITVDGPFFALSNNVGQRAFGVEQYVLVRGSRGPAAGRDGREDDLFAGIL